MGNVASNKVENTSENGRLRGFRIGPATSPILKRDGPQLGPKSQMSPSWGQVAPSWSQVGLKLELSGSKFPVVGALIAEVDPKWSRCCGHVVSKRCIWKILR